jgi:hypothetical protein
MTPAERATAREALARRIHELFNAPSMEAARGAAEEELAFAASLCDHPINTLLAVQRTYEEGEIREQFRTIAAREDFTQGGFKVFSFAESEEPEEPIEEVDLAALSKGRMP